jgi:hypothetical protein
MGGFGGLAPLDEGHQFRRIAGHILMGILAAASDKGRAPGQSGAQDAQAAPRRRVLLAESSQFCRQPFTFPGLFIAGGLRLQQLGFNLRQLLPGDFQVMGGWQRLLCFGTQAGEDALRMIQRGLDAEEATSCEQGSGSEGEDLFHWVDLGLGSET